MSIRFKITLFLVLAMGAFWFATRHFVTADVSRLADNLENDALKRQVVRVQGEMSEWQGEVDRVCAEGADLLATATPVAEHEINPLVAISARLGSVLESRNLQFAAVFAPDGTQKAVVQRFSGGRSRPDALKQEIQLMQLPFNFAIQRKNATSGFIYSQLGILTFSARKITGGSLSGNTFIVGMIINDARVKEMRDITHVEGAQILAVSPDSIPKLMQKYAGNEKEAGPWIAPPQKNAKNLSGYSLVRDPAGQPIGLIEVTQSQRLEQMTRNETDRLFAIMGGLGIVLTIVAVLLVDWYVTRRVCRLAKVVSDASPDNLRALPRSFFQSRDEVGVLSKSIRSMVERLYDSQSRYRAVVETQTELIMRCQPDGELTFVNDAFAEFFGSTMPSFKGRNYFSIIPEELRESERERFEGLSRRNRSNKRELCLTASDGATHWLEWNLRAIVDEKGHVAEVQAVGWDITERRKFEEDLKLAMESAEAANRAKSEFLAVISHEIRTPLNSIMGFSSLVQQLVAEEQARESLQQIQESGRLLLRLFDEIFEFASMDSQTQSLNEMEFPLVSSVESSLIDARHEAAEKGLKFEIDVSPSAPATLVMDSQRLQRVLFILAGNAVKFTQNGIVRISVSTSERATADDPQSLVIEVGDTGIGISDEMKPKLFTPFFQADSSTTRIYGGLGLGLALCKRLVTLMGGTIGVRSEVGKGSVFRVILPAKMPAPLPTA